MYDGLPEFLAFLALIIGGAFGALLSIVVLLVIYLFTSIPLHIAVNAVFLISAASGVSAYLIYSRAIES